MVIASLNSENISVFAFLCSREYFSAQSKGLFLRNKRKMPRKIVAPTTFSQKGYKGQRFEMMRMCHGLSGLHCLLRRSSTQFLPERSTRTSAQKNSNSHYQHYGKTRKRCSARNNRVSVWRLELSCRLFLFSIQKSAFRSKRKSEPFWRIILRVYYGVVVIFIPEEKS